MRWLKSPCSGKRSAHPGHEIKCTVRALRIPERGLSKVSLSGIRLVLSRKLECRRPVKQVTGSVVTVSQNRCLSLMRLLHIFRQKGGVRDTAAGCPGTGQAASLRGCVALDRGKHLRDDRHRCACLTTLWACRAGA